MEKVSDTNENVLESLKNIFIEKNLIKDDEKIGEREEDNDEEEEKEESDLDEGKEEPKVNLKDKKDDLNKDYVYLIKGDEMLEEKKDLKKNKKKKISLESNILDELEI